MAKRKYDSNVIKKAIYEMMYLKNTASSDMDSKIYREYICKKYKLNAASVKILEKQVEILIDKFVDMRASITGFQEILERLGFKK